MEKSRIQTGDSEVTQRLATVESHCYPRAESRREEPHGQVCQELDPKGRGWRVGAKDVTSPRDATRGRKAHRETVVSPLPNPAIFHEGPSQQKPTGNQLAKEPGTGSSLQYRAGWRRARNGAEKGGQ